jgi:hypothetical protein
MLELRRTGWLLESRDRLVLNSASVDCGPTIVIPQLSALTWPEVTGTGAGGKDRREQFGPEQGASGLCGSDRGPEACNKSRAVVCSACLPVKDEPIMM